MRIEIVEECQDHGNFDCDAYGRDWTGNDVVCPGGSRRELSESELLTLVADLAEKVWWCEEHGASRSYGETCDFVRLWNEAGVAMATEEERLDPDSCRVAERLLLPVGVLVDGPKEGT